MKLESISAENWRNVESSGFRPSEELTVLCGENGQGKTNLLEAVWSLTGGRSFRGSKDIELIKENAEFAVLQAEFASRGTQNQMRVTVGRPGSERSGRYIALNGMQPVRAAARAGVFTAVVFDPNHLSLIKGGPEGRRKFLDTALCQLYPAYIKLLHRYSRIVVQKNAFLKDCRALFSLSKSQDELLDVYNRQLAEAGEELSRRRREYLSAISPAAVQNYREISGERESLDLCYLPSFEEGQMLEECRGRRGEEIHAGFCLVGPHREDFEVRLNSRSAKVYASQGQQRSTVLSLKLAEASQISEITGESPVMLMDDVLSELDENRRAWLLTRMRGLQTIVTACDSTEFLKTNGLLLKVEEGKVREI